jgi:hypothetical protein
VLYSTARVDVGSVSVDAVADVSFTDVDDEAFNICKRDVLVVILAFVVSDAEGEGTPGLFKVAIVAAIV